MCKMQRWCFSVCCKSDMNNVGMISALDENSREFSPSALSTEVSFDYDRNKETLHNKIKFVTNNSK